MVSRRVAFTFGLALIAVPAALRPASAQTAAQAASFIEQTGKALVQVVDSPGAQDQKAQQISQIIDQRVDVDGIAKFCLGRFWRNATPEQQKQYLDLFHRVLVISIDSKIGEYKGVTFTVGRSVARDEGQMVSTIISRPGQPPADVDWLVKQVGGAPKITDVVADGTSMRLTQRSDYASFIVHNNESIQALLDAMKRQVSS